MRQPLSRTTLLPLIALCVALSLGACSRKDAGTASDPTTAAFNNTETATSADATATGNATTGDVTGNVTGAATDTGNTTGAGNTTMGNTAAPSP
jgi:hypothetical protein